MRYFWHKLKYHLGSYRKWSAPHSESHQRLVFVCTGNICRSPFAEFVARNYGIEAVSVGTDTRGGDDANSDAVKAARRFGLDLSDHRSTRLQDFSALDGDHFVCMEPKHAELVSRFIPRADVSLMGLWLPERRPFLPDPYGKSMAYFERCFSWIDRAIAKIHE